MESLAQLVIQAREGDTRAFAEIQSRFQDYALGRAYSVLGDHHRAQDVAQEAFLEAYLNLAKLREPEAFPGWFKRIVIKHIDRVIRKRRATEVSLDAAGDIAFDESEAGWALDRDETSQAIQAAINTLPEHERAATNLYYVDERAQKDISEQLDAPVGTIKKRLFTARGRLEKALPDWNPEGGRERSFSPEAQLFAAARNGFVSKAHLLLDAHPELVTCRNEDGLSILLYAAHASHHTRDARIAELLILAGAPLDIQVLAALGMTARVRAYAASFPNAVHQAGPWNRRPLHWAASGGHVSVVENLLNADAPVDHADRWGCTPLHLAVELGHYEVTTQLIDAGARVDATLKNGKTVLHLAAQNGDIPTVELLLKHGASADIFFAAGFGDPNLILRYLRTNRDLVNARLPFGATPLHLAAESGHTAAADALVDNGAELDALCATELGRLDAVEDRLRSNPVDVNARAGSYGFTPLHSATTRGLTDVARVLLARGARVNATDNMYQKTPFGEALYYGNESMATLLAEHGGRA